MHRSILGNNMYSYCENQPIMASDPEGLIFSWIKNAWNNTTQAVANGCNWMQEKAAEAWSWTTQTASDIWDWATNGIEKACSWLSDTKNDIVSWLTQAVKDVFNGIKFGGFFIASTVSTVLYRMADVIAHSWLQVLFTALGVRFGGYLIAAGLSTFPEGLLLVPCGLLVVGGGILWGATSQEIFNIYVLGEEPSMTTDSLMLTVIKEAIGSVVGTVGSIIMTIIDELFGQATTAE